MIGVQNMITLPYLSSLDIFLIWTVIVVLALLAYFLIKLIRLNKLFDSVKKEEKQRWQDLEMQAQKDYHSIIETANKKAQEIIFNAAQIEHESTTKFHDTVKEMLENQKLALNTTSSTLQKKHEEEINALNNEILNLLTNVYKDIEMTAKTDLEKYKELLKQQTFDAEKIAQKRVEEEYQKFEKEIVEAKNLKLKELDDNIYKILSKVSKEIIGKSLDLSTQEELIRTSLEKAKKEGAI